MVINEQFIREGHHIQLHEKLHRILIEQNISSI